MDFSKIWQAFWRRQARHAQRTAMSGVAPLRAPAPESRVGPRASAWVDGHWEQGQFESVAQGAFPALTLNYGLYLPPGEPASVSEAAARTASAHGRARHPATPLVVMLHGCAQSGEALARGTRMNVLADRHGFAVLYPDQLTKRHTHGCWHWYDLTPAAGGVEAHAISSLIAQLVDSHGFDPARVYVAGLSAGAGMATALALRYPTQFAALATHSAPVYGVARSVTSALDVMRRGAQDDPRLAIPSGHPGMPALLLHGAADEVVNPVNLAQLRTQFLALNGMLDPAGQLTADCSDCSDWTLDEHGEPAAPAQCHTYLRAGHSLMQTWLVPALGHAWSGGDDTVPFHAAQGPDASALAWSFFSTHSCPQVEPRAAPMLADTA